MGNSITVKTEGGDVVVRKLALGDYAALLRIFKKLPTEFGKFMEDNDAASLKDNETLFAAIPEIIADAIPEFCQLLALVSDKEAEYYEKEVDLADGLEVFAAALELNDYTRVVNSVKKLMARKPEATQTPTEAA